MDSFNEFLILVVSLLLLFNIIFVVSTLLLHERNNSIVSALPCLAVHRYSSRQTSPNIGETEKEVLYLFNSTIRGGGMMDASSSAISPLPPGRHQVEGELWYKEGCGRSSNWLRRRVNE